MKTDHWTFCDIKPLEPKPEIDFATEERRRRLKDLQQENGDVTESPWLLIPLAVLSLIVWWIVIRFGIWLLPVAGR